MALFLLSFRRPVFFVVGGFFAAMLLERRGLKGMLANRFQRIVVPLVLGWIVLSPMTLAAYDYARAASQAGTHAAGVEALKDWSWVNWERPFHLWFLVALLIYYAGALAVRWALPRVLGARVAAYEAGTRRLLADRGGLWFSAVVAVGLMPSEFLPYNRGNAWLALSLGLFFGLGWRMYVHRDLLDLQTSHARTYAALGLLLLPLATWIKGHVLHGSDDAVAWALASGVASSLLSGLLVFGVIGIFLRHADEHSAVLRYLSDASYWVYLVAPATAGGGAVRRHALDGRPARNAQGPDRLRADDGVLADHLPVLRAPHRDRRAAQRLARAHAADSRLERSSAGSRPVCGGCGWRSADARRPRPDLRDELASAFLARAERPSQAPAHPGQTPGPPGGGSRSVDSLGFALRARSRPLPPLRLARLPSSLL